MMLTKFNYQVDKPLVDNLNQIDDWFVFGSVGFRRKVNIQRMKLLFYKLIRPVEQNNKGQFIVRFEGDNIQRERHFHFLLGKRGLVSNSIKKIQKRLRKDSEETQKRLRKDPEKFQKRLRKDSEKCKN